MPERAQGLGQGEAMRDPAPRIGGMRQDGDAQGARAQGGQEAFVALDERRAEREAVAARVEQVGQRQRQAAAFVADAAS